MASPSSSLASQRPDLAASLMEYNLAMEEQGFVAQRIFPVINVASQAGVFGKVPIEQLLKTMPTVRAPGAAYNRSKWTFEPDSYATVEHGHEEPLDDREREMYGEYLDADTITVQRAQRIVLNNAEIRAAALIQDTGTYTPTGISDEWDDHDAAVPLDDVEGAVARLWAKGIIANALIITWKQFRNLRLCDQIVAKIHSQGAGESVLPGKITVAQLAQAFALKHVVVAEAIKNTAADGLAASISGIWSDEYAAVTRIADTNDIREPCIGRTFHWSGDGSMPNGIVEEYRDESVRSWIYRVRHDVQEKVLYSDCVELLSNAITI